MNTDEYHSDSIHIAANLMFHYARLLIESKELGNG